MLFDRLGCELLDNNHQHESNIVHESNIGHEDVPVDHDSFFGLDCLLDFRTLKWFDSLTRVILGRHDSKTVGVTHLASAIAPHFHRIMRQVHKGSKCLLRCVIYPKRHII